MRRAVLTSIGKIEIQRTELREIAETEVLIELDVCGLCGSDLHIFEGDHPTIKPQVVMGHEFYGKVVQVGSDVKAVQVGESVTAIPGVGCHHCAHCSNGDFNLCPNLQVIGGHIPGAFADYVIVPEENVISVPQSFTNAEGAMIESVAVVLHAIKHFSKVEGRTFAVLGAGPIGLLTLQVLKSFGAKTVIISDPIKARRDLAQLLGADYTIDPKTEDLERTVSQFVNQLGVDGAVDCAGLEITLHQALSITKNGGEIVITAIFGTDPKIPMRLLQRGERKLFGTQMYRKEDFAYAIQLIQDKRVNLEALITNRFKLDVIGNAFSLALSKPDDLGKILIEMK